MNTKPFYRSTSRFLTTIVVTTLLLLSYSPLQAQSLYDMAQEQARTGDIAGMADSYLKILQQNPDDITARLGYATANAWLGQHDKAQEQFRRVLDQQPSNLEALSGLGYDYAWAGQYAKAEKTFNNALSLAPENPGIQKGLAFTYLWSKQYEKSLNIFNRLGSENPQDAEIQAARGQALLALGRDQAAASAFRTALKIDADREDAKNGLKTIEQKAIQLKATEQMATENKPAEEGNPVFDISAWYGSTSDGGDSGLREVTLGYSIKNDSRLWFRFDDSLSLDNPALARSGEKAETGYLGLQTRMNAGWLGVIEIGHRDLPDNADQQIYKVEGIRIQSSRSYKFGVQVSPHSDDYTDKLVFASLGYPLNTSWRLEPTLYLSSSGAIADKEIRAVLFAEYLALERWSIGLGAGLGRISSDNSAVEGSVSTANALLSYAIDQKTRLNLAVRYEDSPTSSFSTLLAGITVQLP